MSCLHLEGLMGELQVLVVIDRCHLLMGSESRCHHYHHHHHHHHHHYHHRHHHHFLTKIILTLVFPWLTKW